jgi:hypothetical protein
MVTLDYETPKPRGPDRLGNLSLLICVWSPVSFLIATLCGMGHSYAAGAIVLLLSVCAVIVGAVLGLWSLVSSGVSWQAVVGLIVNGTILLLVIFLSVSP